MSLDCTDVDVDDDVVVVDGGGDGVRVVGSIGWESESMPRLGFRSR